MGEILSIRCTQESRRKLKALAAIEGVSMGVMLERLVDSKLLLVSEAMKASIPEANAREEKVEPREHKGPVSPKKRKKKRR